MRVKATREGLLGGKTASGYIVDGVVPFVALPASVALGQFVRLTNPANQRTCLAVVLDVGPWTENDTAYVLHGERPAAERGISKSGKGTNGAGIDLGEAVWRKLGMVDNADIEWEWVQ